MRYLTLAADYRDPSIYDQRFGRQDLEQIDLPQELVLEILAWNNDYQVVIPLDLGARKAKSALISELDRRGVELAERLSDAIEGPVKVRYYSEGTLAYVT